MQSKLQDFRSVICFSIEIIKLYKELIRHKKYVIAKQLLRSATSIGANAEGASAAISKGIL